ncbi:MAG: CgeB family protein [Desulfovibrio sp.]
MATLTIFSVNMPQTIDDHWTSLGHNVISTFWPHPTFLDLEEVLDGTMPDIIIQREVLHQKIILKGLSKYTCPRAYWALDPHLNAYWQAAYCNLFDAVFTTQRYLTDELQQYGAVEPTWIPAFAQPQRLTPWSKRQFDISFAGRVSTERPIRTHFIEQLTNLFSESFRHEQDLNVTEMFAMYCDTKIIPNESILGETNFRFFEAPSCGSLLITPQTHPDQDLLLTPNVECVTYADGLEFVSLLRYYLEHPLKAQRIALAGYERVRNEHTASHRAQRMFDVIENSTTNGVRTVEEEEYWLTLTYFLLWQTQQGVLPPSKLLDALLSHTNDDIMLAAAIHMLSASGGEKGFFNILEIKNSTLPDSFIRSKTALSFALLSGIRQGYTADSPKGDVDLLQDASDLFFQVCNSTPLHISDQRSLIMYWHDYFADQKRIFRSGMTFNEETNLPESALDCLFLLLHINSNDLQAIDKLNSHMREIQGQEYARSGLLSHLTLHSPLDWHLGLEKAIVDLQSFRLESGTEELFHSYCVARDAGHAEQYSRKLSTYDARGLKGQWLKKMSGDS